MFKKNSANDGKCRKDQPGSKPEPRDQPVKEEITLRGGSRAELIPPGNVKESGTHEQDQKQEHLQDDEETWDLRFWGNDRPHHACQKSYPLSS